MKRLLLGTSAIVLALVMNGAAYADGHGKGHGNGHGNEGWHGWQNGPVWNNGWENRWYGDYWGYRYYNPYVGYGNPWNGYMNWANMFGYLPGAAYGWPGYLAPAFRLPGMFAPAYGTAGAYMPGNLAPGGYGAVLPPPLPGPASLSGSPPPLPGAANLLPRVQVVLPNPEADVTIGGQKMGSLGMVRTFELPAVEQGKTDTYKVTASWVDGGKTITDVRKVSVTPGSAATVDFTQPAPVERVNTPVKSEPDTQNVSSPSKTAPPP